MVITIEMKERQVEMSCGALDRPDPRCYDAHNTKNFQLLYSSQVQNNRKVDDLQCHLISICTLYLMTPAYSLVPLSCSVQDFARPRSCPTLFPRKEAMVSCGKLLWNCQSLQTLAAYGVQLLKTFTKDEHCRFCPAKVS